MSASEGGQPSDRSTWIDRMVQALSACRVRHGEVPEVWNSSELPPISLSQWIGAAILELPRRSWMSKSLQLQCCSRNSLGTKTTDAFCSTQVISNSETS